MLPVSANVFAGSVLLAPRSGMDIGCSTLMVSLNRWTRVGGRGVLSAEFHGYDGESEHVVDGSSS